MHEVSSDIYCIHEANNDTIILCLRNTACTKLWKSHIQLCIHGIFLSKNIIQQLDISTKLIPDCKELRLTTTLETIKSVVRPQLVIPWLQKKKKKKNKKKKNKIKKDTKVNKRQKTRKFFQINYQWLHALAAASPSPPWKQRHDKKN